MVMQGYQEGEKKYLLLVFDPFPVGMHYFMSRAVEAVTCHLLFSQCCLSDCIPYGNIWDEVQVSCIFFFAPHATIHFTL